MMRLEFRNLAMRHSGIIQQVKYWLRNHQIMFWRQPKIIDPSVSRYPLPNEAGKLAVRIELYDVQRFRDLYIAESYTARSQSQYPLLYRLRDNETSNGLLERIVRPN